MINSPAKITKLAGMKYNHNKLEKKKQIVRNKKKKKNLTNIYKHKNKK